MDYTDTIVAVSSAAGGPRSIVRITGPDALAACQRVFTEPIALRTNGVLCASVAVAPGVAVDATVYLFFSPHSYTGETLAELHVHAGPALVAALVEQLLATGLRAAGPGEFTARAYLNGKLDLAQAEAVNEIVAGSNRFQLDAAERLLSGRLTETTKAAHLALVDCLSLIEAGLDFSGEDIAFIGPADATQRLARIRDELEGLLTGSIRYESLIDLPSVGIAGAPNAGKSSLLNALLGHERSLVSDRRKTTRDVLSGLWTTDRFQCVLFDCAGLLTVAEDILDRLAQQAAIEALRHCQAVVFCVEAAKPDIGEDLAIRALIQPKTVLYAASKADLLSPADSQRAVETLAQAFAGPFLPVSALTGQGLRQLQDLVERSLSAGQETATREGRDTVALTARHRQAVSEAVANIDQAIVQIEQGADEIAAAMICAACQALSDIEQQPIDEQVLDHIFSRFCVGK
ncbi:tRNA modification GTPase [Anaerobaca lacustris]|uniref:tRNA modification GTPase MnmE n=1 Tax=Anaerobaca lacustris TaxID=3044600 RepID=A0AAW6TZ03_9BACT|nr:50S ribosome-binding GTPase [Sedimentisphaerales bacterium M17dextr]